MSSKYGSMGEEKHPDNLPLVGFSNSGDAKVQIDNNDFNPDDPFDEAEHFKKIEFWDEVKALHGSGKFTRSEAQRRIRVKYLQESTLKEDLLIKILTTIHEKYKNYCYQNSKLELFPLFLFEVNEFTRVILEDDARKDEPRYPELFDIPCDGTVKTILHLAAERNLTQVADIMVSLYPKLVNVTTTIDGIDLYPLHFALQGFHDETASLLINSMENWRVRHLFECGELEDAQFKFKDYIIHPNMKKTVMSILDCLINPEWPFIPVNPFIPEGEKDKETQESAWSTIPNIPIRYHFYYRLLDGDSEGRAADDYDFDRQSKSCLQLIADTETLQKEAVLHPVVRLLVRRKWKKYGLKSTIINFSLYAVFLLALSLAFFLPHSSISPTSYESVTDYVRLVCEVITLLFTLGYICSEIDQAYKEGVKYLKDFFNYCDFFGMLFILLLIPCRFTHIQQVEWALASVAYLINFLRVFKFFPAHQTLGRYSRTFMRIIIDDVSKFSLVFFITMFAFTGAVFMALKASTGVQTVGFSGFGAVFLQEIRALTEGKEFADDYSLFKPIVVVLVMLNMFCVMVVIVNILIGQISYRYEEALTGAIIQFDIDKTKLVTSMERSMFKNYRVEHYMDGDFVDEKDLEEDLLDDWLALKSYSKSTEDKLKAIQKVMNSKVKRSYQEKAVAGEN